MTGTDLVAIIGISFFAVAVAVIMTLVLFKMATSDKN
ncbi:hypothetical protein SAMN04488123_10993 [Natribacillus halophilus]|uniref:Holin-like Toxin (Hol-Tox) n=1 Tax=Natribacillus halophilus TaxID=549003 RepID=A0A1G8PT05_9BACI|nr:hypothetical protein SAMN04488123_10993 [Natribacillus halophilus]